MTRSFGISNIPRFHKTLNAMKLLNNISESGSPKISFLTNFQFSVVSRDCRYLETDALLLGQKARQALLKAKRISKRIMTAEFDGNPKTTVIVVYAPTNCADEVEVEGFYNDLSNTL